MIKEITDFMLMIILFFLMLMVIKFTQVLFTDYTRAKIESMPFDSRLCTNTGKMHRYIVIGEKGAVIERYEPILDCTNLDKYNEGLK